MRMNREDTKINKLNSQFYECVIAFAYRSDRSKLLKIASCLGTEDNQYSIRFALGLLELNERVAKELTINILRRLDS